MTTELVAHMRLSHYKTLWRTLYGCAHGFGERKLKLNLTCGQSGFVIEMPVVCHYEENIPTLSTQGVSKSEWSKLCNFVSDESVLKVIFFDRAHDFLARVTSVGAKPPKADLYQVKFRWREDDEIALVWRKGIQWISEMLE
ncbi:uncharacterized protein EKO05_0001837 [Ascochyta rabiei]|uniref:Uncharacterized protein n=1 Tax=Didymella rabiei TaxID=5454 RepID=A0A163KU67_DIDRA|nr:uncharacterized protein EKO05_0001837 [Ascochyta rabiei]KZM27254.1 hypothetical protein ST47_g1602 [Ascochyta rabiei]UPX11217.1 hypothetical protein EKO05_0001837 [Ascochyta rabiei]